MANSNRWYNASCKSTKRLWIVRLMPNGKVLCFSGSTHSMLTPEQCAERFTRNNVCANQCTAQSYYNNWVNTQTQSEEYAPCPSTWSDQQNLDHYILTTAARD